MSPIRTNACNGTLVAEGCADLPVLWAEGFVCSYWRPSPEELAALNAGIPLRLAFQGRTHPPVAVEVEAL